MSGDSETAQTYRAMNERSKLRKQENLAASTKRLIDNAVVFDSKNDGLHLICYTPKGKVQFWPSTGQFQRVDKTWGRGVFQLLKLCGVEEPV